MGFFKRENGTGTGPGAPSKGAGSRSPRVPADWNRFVEESHRAPVVVFKHSLTCGISAHVLADCRELLEARDDLLWGIVDVVGERPLSDRIAAETGVRHESPQVIIIRNGQPIWHRSHWSIDPAEIERVLAAELRRTRDAVADEA